MIDIEKFSALQKASKDSFAKQKQLMKSVMAGKTVLCAQCQQPLHLFTPEKIATNNSKPPGVRCKKGCTDLQLDFV
jgi:hypothetical protein